MTANVRPRTTPWLAAFAALALVSARSAAQEPPDEKARIAELVAADRQDDAMEAIRKAGGSPDGALNEAAIQMLVDVKGYNAISRDRKLALMKRGYDEYRSQKDQEPFAMDLIASPYAGALMEFGRAAEAEVVLRRQLERYERCCTLDSGGAFEYSRRLAEALEAQQRYAEADILLSRIWQIADGWEQYDNEASFAILRDRARNLRLDRRTGEARAFVGDVLARARRSKDISPETLIPYLLVAGRLALADRDVRQAEALAREAVANGRRDGYWGVSAFGDTPEAQARALLAEILEATGRAAEAEAIRRTLLAMIEDNDFIPEQFELHRPAQLALARNLAMQGKQAEADALFASQSAAVTRIWGAASPQLLEIVDPFARYLLASGRPLEALVPARRMLAARLAQIERTASTSGEAAQRRSAKDRQGAARFVVRAAWQGAQGR